MTLLVSAISLVFGSLAGFLAAGTNLSRRRALRFIADPYTSCSGRRRSGEGQKRTFTSIASTARFDPTRTSLVHCKTITKFNPR
jgi:hypothetical protein